MNQRITEYKVGNDVVRKTKKHCKIKISNKQLSFWRPLMCFSRAWPRSWGRPLQGQG